jgi:YidC/Oxa1 family membrane protein insertase
MDDQNKNLILATVLSFLVILVWFTVFAPPPPVVDTSATAPAASQSTGASQTTAANQSTAASQSTGAQTNTAAPALPLDAATEAAQAAAPRISIDTPHLSGSFSLLGGTLDDLSLMAYNQTLAPTSAKVRLLAHAATGLDTKPYYAIYGWMAGGGLDPKLLPTALTLWTVEKGTTVTPTTPVTILWDNGAGLIFRRTIAVDDDYMFTMTQTVENNTGAAVKLTPYGLVLRQGKPLVSGTYVSHEGVVRMADGKLLEVTYKKVPSLDVDPVEGPSEVLKVDKGGWVGFTDKYWMTTLIPTPGQPYTSVVKYVADRDIYETSIRLSETEVAPGATSSASSMLFAGAKEWEAIRGYQQDLGIDRFDDSIDWGWYFFLTKPMFRVLHWLHGTIGNMGWAIVALTFIIKALVFPLARKSYVSMAKMMELQPEMEALKEAAGDDRQKMQKGMMELYKKNKVNPASGCLPILLQIPIFFSLYKVIYNTIELYHAPFIGWIHDLSAPDPSSILNLFGLLPWATPEQGSFLFILSLGVLPILLGISMWFQQKLNPAPTDATQAAIFAWMPWIFMFMLGSFASGLVLYWITNNTITFLQQYTIMSMHGKRPDLFGNILSGFKRDKTGAK